jgi:hypothetical protein
MNGADDDSPEVLYALTLTVWRPLENGSGTEQLHVPSLCRGVKP